VRALSDLGAGVTLEQGDIADRGDTERLIAGVLARFGRIDGVVHAAGVLDDSLIMLKDVDAAARVLRPKVRGTAELDRALGRTPIDFWINCSSVSSLVGLPGQIDYAAANAFLDAFSHWKSRRDGTHTVSVNWCAWRDVGMLRKRPVAGTPVSSTLLHRHRADGDADVFESDFDVERDWFLNEHRLKSGEPLLPGAAFLEIGAQAARHASPDGALELRDVVFLSPFVVADRTRTLTLTRDRRSGEFEIRSKDSEVAGQAGSEHVRGVARRADATALPRADIEAIKRRCPTTVADPCPNLRHLRVGPRWGSTMSVGLGQGEACATLELPAPFVPELPRYVLHPALLDLATSFALWLVPEYAPGSDFYVPLSYGRVLITNPLPGRIFCHAEVKPPSAAAPDLAIFDVRIYDSSGEAICAVEHFVVKRLARFDGLTTAPGTARASSGPSGVATSSSIRAAEGAAAFLHLLGALPIAQVSISPAPVDELVAAADRNSRPSPGAPGGSHGRPNISTPMAEPRDDLERQLAAIWSDLLGVSQVGIDDNFFELGGHSLLLAQVASRVRRSLDRQMPITMLFERPTIRQMAEHCRVQGRVDDEPALVPVSRDHLRKSRAALEAQEDR
jgi:NAD(P)-dependent dehydrogenase (short-subunit alcohol dehydrogenase family)